jgi:diguanylate cyclase (GGDEF)-like protein
VGATRATLQDMSPFADVVRVAVTPRLEQPRETSGLTIRLIISYVRHRLGEDGVTRLLQVAGETRPLSVLENERVWSSYDAKVALLAAAGQVTGEPDIGIRVGRYVLDSSIGASVRLVLGLVASPAALLRHIASVNGKFSAISDMTATTEGRTSAVVTYRVHDGYVPSTLDCDYTAGMLSQVPAVFGLPSASVRQVACQSRGATECRYEMTWSERGWRRWFRRQRSVDEHVVHQRMQDLQHAVTDLVGSSGTDLSGILSQIAERAAYAINARRFLLVTQVGPSAPARVHADGFTDAEADEIGRQLLSGEPLDVPDKFIVAPVRSAAHDYGRIAAFAAAEFFDPERELLEAYAALAAASLDALVARQVAEERRHTAEVLLKFASDVAFAVDSRAVAAMTADALRTLVGADAAAVLLRSADGEALFTSHSGFAEPEADFVDQLRIRTHGSRYVAPLMDSSRSHVVLAAGGDDEPVTRALRRAGLEAAVGVGLHSPQRAHGVAFACWRRRSEAPPVDERLLFRLQGLASQATIALDKSDLLSQVRHQADTDPLTGLPNRRCFVEQLESALAAGPESEPVGALLFMDLDGFKAVNDTLGHAAGDELLRVVAARLSACVRETDVVSRLGGDEFTVLLGGPHTDFAVREFASRVLATFEEPIELGGPLVHARPSIGGVLVCAGGDADEALRLADDAMYRAKAAGGRRLVLADDAA